MVPISKPLADTPCLGRSLRREDGFWVEHFRLPALFGCSLGLLFAKAAALLQQWLYAKALEIPS